MPTLDSVLLAADSSRSTVSCRVGVSCSFFGPAVAEPSTGAGVEFLARTVAGLELIKTASSWFEGGADALSRVSWRVISTEVDSDAPDGGDDLFTNAGPTLSKPSASGQEGAVGLAWSRTYCAVLPNRSSCSADLSMWWEDGSLPPIGVTTGS